MHDGLEVGGFYGGGGGNGYLCSSLEAKRLMAELQSQGGWRKIGEFLICSISSLFWLIFYPQTTIEVFSPSCISLLLLVINQGLQTSCHLLLPKNDID